MTNCNALKPERSRTFLEIVVRYPAFCTYPEYEGKPYYAIKYEGKPYYAIKYEENGETIVGFGTYKPKVLSRYLREYFLPSAEPERKDELDSIRLAYMDILTDYVALKNYWAEQQENAPLTWDELKTMQGKPVWIDSVPLVRRWVIIKKFHPIGGNKNLFDMEVEDGAHFLRKNMRRDDPAWWQAYRKERE